MPGIGKITVVGMVLVAVAVGGWTVWFQHQRSRAVLDFWGPASARLISAAPVVEITAGSPAQSVSPSASEISRAKGMQNIRHALIQSETFLWDTRTSGNLADWDYSLQFRDGSTSATVLFSLAKLQVALEGGDSIVQLHPVAGKELKLFCEEQFTAKP